MATDLGTLYFYEGIDDTNYADADKFHTVERPDASLLIGVTKLDPDQDTTIDVQICLEDVSVEENWFYLLRAINAVTNDSGNGTLVSAPTGGFTGVRIIPADAATEFSLSVREYFVPTKIKVVANNEYIVE